MDTRHLSLTASWLLVLFVTIVGCSGLRGGGSAHGERSAVSSLVASAEIAEAEGRLDDAAQHLERALRLEPRHAQLWVRLARVLLSEGRPDRAEPFALKATTLADGDRETARSSWLIVAACRDARGDATGADEARSRADR